MQPYLGRRSILGDKRAEKRKGFAVVSDHRHAFDSPLIGGSKQNNFPVRIDIDMDSERVVLTIYYCGESGEYLSPGRDARNNAPKAQFLVTAFNIRRLCASRDGLLATDHKGKYAGCQQHRI